VNSGPQPEAAGVGYKVFCVRDERLYGVLIDRDPYKEGEWITDTEQKTLYSAWDTYDTGFHFFRHKPDAQIYLRNFQMYMTVRCLPGVAVLRKVRYRNVCAIGEHSVIINTDVVMKPCIVAKEMFIEPEEEPEEEKQCA
jgi:hypothetical protein